MSTGCLSCIPSSHQQNFTLNKMFESILKALDQIHSNTSYTLGNFAKEMHRAGSFKQLTPEPKIEPKGNMLRYCFLCVPIESDYGTFEVPDP